MDYDLLQVKETHFAEHVEILMVEATKGLDMEVKLAEQNTTYNIIEKMKVILPEAE